MSSKGMKFVMILAAAAAAALVGCAGKNVYPKLDPGGPIIVVVPEPESVVTPGSSNPDNDYTVWYAGCPGTGGLPPKADRTSTYKGIPARLSDPRGAESIVVTLKEGHKPYNFIFNADGNSFSAKIVTFEFITTPNLTIGLDAPGNVPKWTITPPLEDLKPQSIVPLHNFSNYLYGHIVKLPITDTGGKSDIVVVADLHDIKLVYNPQVNTGPCR